MLPTPGYSVQFCWLASSYRWELVYHHFMVVLIFSMGFAGDRIPRVCAFGECVVTGGALANTFNACDPFQHMRTLSTHVSLSWQRTWSAFGRVVNVF
jgi:hypothetical protein